MSSIVTPPQDQLPLTPEDAAMPVSAPTLPEEKYLRIVLATGAIGLVLLASIEAALSYLT